MYTLLTVLMTLLGIGAVVYLVKLYNKHGIKPKWYTWAGYALCYAILAVAVSFTAVNFDNKHMKAASTGFVLFVLTALVLTILNMRLSGIKLNSLLPSKGGKNE